MKYLIADDSKLARLSVAKSISLVVDTPDITHASNGEEALNNVKESDINVVFLDLTMPIMDGYEAIP